jgi:hypothetical protein
MGEVRLELLHLVGVDTASNQAEGEEAHGALQVPNSQETLLPTQHLRCKCMDSKG